MKSFVVSAVLGVFILIAPQASASDSEITIPGVRHSGNMQTDLALFNPSLFRESVELELLRSSGAPQMRTIVIEPAESKRILDVIGAMFPENTSGTLRVRATAPIMVNARQRILEAGNVLREYFLAPSEAENQIVSGDSADLTFPRGMETAIATITVAEIDGAEAMLDVDVLSASGNLIERTAVNLSAFEVVEQPVDISDGIDRVVRVGFRHGGGRVSVGGVFSDGISQEATPVFALLKTTRRHRAAGAARLTGSVILRLTAPIAQEDRAEFQQHRSELANNGFTLASDASSVTFPDSTPSGWRIRIGTQQTTTRADGTFRIASIPGLPAQGVILDPVDPQPLGSFSIAQIAQPIVLQLQFTGVCNMNAADKVIANCHTGSSLELVPLDAPTYPPARRADSCEQLDGFVSSNTSPLLSYFGSTCNKRVVAGCCPNEGGWGIFSATICCVKNHRGRFCQELTPDDLKILGDSLIVVDLGDTVTVTIHNNGCFGDTTVVNTANDIGGSLTGAGFDGATIQHYDAQKLAAFNCGKGSASDAWGIWIGDRVLTYTTPKCLDSATGGEQDQWVMTADATAVTLTFQLKPDLLWQFVDTSQVFSLNTALKDGWHIANPDACSGMHVHGKHPCTGVPDPNPTGCGQGIVVKVGK